MECMESMVIQVCSPLVDLFVCVSQGPQGPQGVQGEKGPIGEGFAGPKV